MARMTQIGKAIEDSVDTLTGVDTAIPTSKAVKDITDLKAPIASPTFTGLVTTPALKVTTNAAAGKILVSDADGDLGYLAAGATTEVLVGGGAAEPVWTAATGTGAPVRAASPALSGTPTAPTAAANTDTTQIATTAFVTAATRELLTSSRTYYVRTDGNDSNTGLVNSAAGAFLTPQHAYDVVVSNLDLGGQFVYINIGDGTYTPSSGTIALNINSPWIGGGQVIIQGNAGNMSAVILSTTNNHAISISGLIAGVLTIRYLKVQTASWGHGIVNTGSGVVYIGDIDFGACASAHISVNGAASTIYSLYGTFGISGSANQHISSEQGGVVIMQLCTITFSTNATFWAFIYASAGIVNTYNSTYDVNGKTVATTYKYYVKMLSTLFKGTASYPGSGSDYAGTGSQVE